MRRAHVRRKAPLPGRYYRLRITPDMAGISLAAAINLLDKQGRYRKPRLKPRYKPFQKEN